MDDNARSSRSARAAKGDARREPRDSLSLHAMLHLSDESAPRAVRIRNLSERGLMAEVGREVPIGTPAQIVLGGIGEITGQVVWCIDDRIGVALDQPIDPASVQSAD